MNILRGMWRQQTSIRSRVIVTLVVTLVVMLSVSVLSIAKYSSFVSWTNETVELNAKLSEVPLLLSRVVTLFEAYTTARVAQLRDDFVAESARLDSTLSQLSGIHYGAPRISAYERSLRTMFDYYRTSALEIAERSVFDSAVYTELQFLRVLGNQMTRRAQEFVVASVELSSERHAAFVRATSSLVQRLAISMLFLSCVLGLATLFLIRDLSSHLEAVEATARRLSMGDWNVPDLAETRYSELASVADAFNEMKHNIVSFVQSVEHTAELDAQLHREQLAHAEKERLLRQTQLKALQQQINPHFLFNTLNLIGRTAMFHDTDATIALVEAISEILRFNLDNEGRHVPLSRELEILRSYVVVQQARFGARVSIELVLPPFDTDPEVPPMILQPLVENALVHGLKDCRAGGKVRVVVTETADVIEIAVADNGVGIAGDRLEQIESDADVHNTEHHSIGLKNVRARLKLAFGNSDALSINPGYGTGAIVTVRIPTPVEVYL